MPMQKVLTGFEHLALIAIRLEPETHQRRKFTVVIDYGYFHDPTLSETATLNWQPDRLTVLLPYPACEQAL
jgi:hypothetical protein